MITKKRLASAIRDMSMVIGEGVDESFDQENLDSIRGLLEEWNRGLDKIQEKIDQRKLNKSWEKIYGRSGIVFSSNKLDNKAKKLYLSTRK